MSIEDMKNVDVRTVDCDSLVDINEINIDESLPPKERAEEFLRQIMHMGSDPICSSQKNSEYTVRDSLA